MKFNLFLRYRVFQKQLFSYFAVLLMVSSIIGYVVFSAAYNMLRVQSEKHYQMIINEVKESIDNRFNELYRLDIQMFGAPWFTRLINMKPEIDMERVSEYDLRNIYDELANYKAVNSFIEDIFIYFKNSDTIISPYGRDDADWFFKSILKTPDPSQNDIYTIIQGSSPPKIVQSRQISFFNRTYDALVYMRSPSIGCEATVVTLVRRDKLTMNLERLDKNVFILDKNNNVVAGNVAEVDEQLTKNDLYKETGGILYEKINGVDHIMYYVNSKVSDWRYVAAVPLKNIIGDAEYLKRLFILIFIFSVISGLAINAILTKKNLDPIQRIIQAISGVNGTKQQNVNMDLEVVGRTFHRIIDEKAAIEKEMKKYEPVLKSNLLSKLVKGDLADEDYIIYSLEKFGIKFPFSYFTVLIFFVESFDSGSLIRSYNAGEMSVILLQTLQNLMKEFNHNGHAFESDDDRFILILNTECYFNAVQESGFVKVLDKLKDLVESDFNLVITISAGNTHQSIGGINWSFNEASQALDYKLVIGKDKIIHYNDIDAHNTFTYFFPMEKEVKLIQSVKSGDYEKVEYILDSIMHENMVNRHLNFNIARCFFYDLEATVLKAAEEFAPNLIDRYDISNELSKLNTFTEMISYIKTIYRDVCEIINQKRGLEQKSFTKEIMEYMENSFSDSRFSLDAIAEKFHMSKSFISKFFYKQTGMYYSDYLNKLRMEKARWLLENTNLQVKDIAIEVGYINDITFRRIFKQFASITPGEYRGITQKT